VGHFDANSLKRCSSNSEERTHSPAPKIPLILSSPGVSGGGPVGNCGDTVAAFARDPQEYA
jgi:hypothetical protein